MAEKTTAVDWAFRLLASCALPAVGWAYTLSMDVAVMQSELGGLRDRVESRGAELATKQAVAAVAASQAKIDTALVRLDEEIDELETSVARNAAAAARLDAIASERARE